MCTHYQWGDEHENFHSLFVYCGDRPFIADSNHRGGACQYVRRYRRCHALDIVLTELKNGKVVCVMNINEKSALPLCTFYTLLNLEPFYRWLSVPDGSSALVLASWRCLHMGFEWIKFWLGSLHSDNVSHILFRRFGSHRGRPGTRLLSLTMIKS